MGTGQTAPITSLGACSRLRIDIDIQYANINPDSFERRARHDDRAEPPAFEAWDRLRNDQRLSRPRAKAAMNFATASLLERLDENG